MNFNDKEIFKNCLNSHLMLTFLFECFNGLGIDFLEWLAAEDVGQFLS